MRLRDQARELFELGPQRAAFRLLWEAQRRSGWFALTDRLPALTAGESQRLNQSRTTWLGRRLFTAPSTMRAAMQSRLTDAQRVEERDQSQHDHAPL